MLKNPAESEGDISPDSLLGISASIFQRALVDESGMIRIQMGTHNRSENTVVHGTLCTITLRKNNQ
jgi:hypothetical protein